MAELIPLHPRPEAAPTLDPLWRHLLGGRLRRLRHERGETLTETATRAGVSPQYLSEVERGRKEASSEMVAAILGALGSSLLDLTMAIGDELRRREPLTSEIATAPAAVPARVELRAGLALAS